MSEDARGASASWGLVGGIFGAVIVAVFSTWLSAESSRVEALRQERRTAYADLLGTAHDCHGEFSALLFKNRFSVAEIERLAQTGRPEDLRAAQGDQAIGQAVASEEALARCFTRLSSSSARVRILTDNTPLRDASWALDLATTYLGAAGKEKEADAQLLYDRAISEFEKLATTDGNSPVLSPFVIQLGALVLLEVMLIVLLFFGLRLSKGR